jgi:hypothetical protein
MKAGDFGSQAEYHFDLEVLRNLPFPSSFPFSQRKPVPCPGQRGTPISGSIRAERETRKNSQLAAAQRVGLKMGRRLRCSSVTYPL